MVPSVYLLTLPKLIRCHPNLELGHFFGANIVYVALQQCLYMGFKRVFILGMDLNYSGTQPRFYESHEDARPSGLEKQMELAIQPSFEIVRQICQDSDLEIYNVSPGSGLPATIVKKLDLDQMRSMMDP